MEFVFGLVGLLIVLFLMVRIDSRRVRKLPFMQLPVAHRGLYAKDQSIPENSLAAFRSAVQHGYAIELDVQCSKDLEVFVFHDNSLQRMCLKTEQFSSMDADEIRALKLGNTNEPIPTLRDTLREISGKVPLWIEIKTTKRRKETVAKVMEQLSTYQGDYSVCSFDPIILLELRRAYPSVLRGIIVEGFSPAGNRPWFVRIILYFCLLNFLTKPDYQSFQVEQRNNPIYRFNRLLGALSVFWVIRSAQQEEHVRRSCDNIIFEHYHPISDKSV